MDKTIEERYPMKVKDLIKQLEELNQEKDIWINYEDYSYCEPRLIRQLDADDKDAHKGDYYIYIG